MNIKFTKKSEYVLAALFGLVAAFPLAVSTPIGDASGFQATVSTTEQQRALDNKAQYRDNRRDYADATQLCITLRANGKNITCPDINDAAGIANFLKTHNNVPPTDSTVHAAAPEKITTSDLSTNQKQLLRWYRKINTCPLSLKDSMPAFYDLCTSFLNPNPVLFQNNSTSVDATYKPAASLDQIIDANKGVRRTQ